jgi:predicted nucleic acid-binding protein
VTDLLDTNAISDLMRASPRIEGWIASLATVDRDIACTIVRGEILFGIARLPKGKRRTELEETSLQFLSAFRCEPIPERAADFYADLKLAGRKTPHDRSHGMPSDPTSADICWIGILNSSRGVSLETGHLTNDFAAARSLFLSGRRLDS